VKLLNKQLFCNCSFEVEKNILKQIVIFILYFFKFVAYNIHLRINNIAVDFFHDFIYKKRWTLVQNL